MFTQPFRERDLLVILMLLPFDEIIREDDERSISIPMKKVKNRNLSPRIKTLAGN